MVTTLRHHIRPDLGATCWLTAQKDLGATLDTGRVPFGSGADWRTPALRT